MNILGSIFVFIISGYIAFTNALATQIENILPTSEKAGEEEILTDEMSLLPSIFGNRIPDILLSSAAYQQAALSNAGTSGQTASTPEEALVNVFCTFTTDDLVRTTTGSGFFIDPDGIIMTNAHVAQFLLLEETEEFGETDCIIRTGNPASPRYRAELLYLPPAWIEENADNLSQTIPLGTGERDYALLYVSESIDGGSTPIVFPALMVADDLLPVSVRGDEVVAAGYPASELIRNGSNTPLNAQVADTTISELYTFGSNYADVIAVRGSAVGAEGASGGGASDLHRSRQRRARRQARRSRRSFHRPVLVRCAGQGSRARRQPRRSARHASRALWREGQAGSDHAEDGALRPCQAGHRLAFGRVDLRRCGFALCGGAGARDPFGCRGADAVGPLRFVIAVPLTPEAVKGRAPGPHCGAGGRSA